MSKHSVVIVWSWNQVHTNHTLQAQKYILFNMMNKMK